MAKQHHNENKDENKDAFKGASQQLNLDGIDPTILAIAEKIAREYQPEKIILFGSHAWGTPGPDSDVDLFIVKSGLRTSKHLRTTDVDRILDRSPAAWDALVYTPREVEERIALGDFFIRRIVDEGRVLYER